MGVFSLGVCHQLVTQAVEATFTAKQKGIYVFLQDEIFNNRIQMLTEFFSFVYFPVANKATDIFRHIKLPPSKYSINYYKGTYTQSKEICNFGL
jgi:hypothetical protein